jgi:4-hydroxy-tetrahydrodipicolinate reductase
VIPIVVHGAAGRMGRLVMETAAGDPVFLVKAAVDTSPKPVGFFPDIPWGSDLTSVLQPGHVVVDFSVPEATVRAAKACRDRGAALVSGTTGLGSEQEASVQEAARSVPILRAANFSLGMAALRRGLKALLSAIPEWDVEIVERHHRAKQDSPSGTALALARDVTQARGYPASSLRHGREGRVGARPAAEVGVHAVRGGSWVGDHSILLAGMGEWLELRHVAQDRSAFARGALAAAGFVAKAKPGLYTLEAVLNATEEEVPKR